MVGHYRLEKIKPEQRHLREDATLTGDPAAKYAIERRDAVSGDKEQMAVQFVNIPHFPARLQGQRQLRFEQDFVLAHNRFPEYARALHCKRTATLKRCRKAFRWQFSNEVSGDMPADNICKPESLSDITIRRRAPMPDANKDG